MAELKTSIVIEAQDRFSKPVAGIGGASKKLGKEAGALAAKMRALDKRDKTIQAFRAVEARIGKSAAEMDSARRRASELGRKLKEAGIPTKRLERASLDLTKAQKKMAREADAGQDAARRATEAHRRQKSELGRLGAELREAGIDTRRLGDAQRKLTGDMEAAVRKMDRYRDKAERLTRMQGKLDRFTGNVARLSLIAGEGSRLVSGAMRIATGPLERLHDMESARGELATLFVGNGGAVDRESVDAVAEGARAASERMAGVTPADYLRAAYQTKSGIAGLDAQGVVDMTDLAALTARATVADTMEIADLALPTIETFAGGVEWAVAKLEALISAWPRSTTVAIAVTALGAAITAAGIGVGIAVRMLQTAAGGLSYALDFLWVKILRMDAGGGAVGGGGGGRRVGSGRTGGETEAGGGQAGRAHRRGNGQDQGLGGAWRRSPRRMRLSWPLQRRAARVATRSTSWSRRRWPIGSR